MTLETHIERVDFINYNYPTLYILIRQQEGVTLQEIIMQYMSLHEDPRRMTAYIHLCFLPYLDMLRQQNKLKQGKRKVEVVGRDWDYEGEMDGNDDCVGLGTATDEYGTKYYGTWLNNERHGTSKSSALDYQTIY